MATLARLALIAEELGETDLANTYRENVKAVLTTWLEGGAASSLDLSVRDPCCGCDCNMHEIGQDRTHTSKRFFFVFLHFLKASRPLTCNNKNGNI